jgi:hypothetical protein
VEDQWFRDALQLKSRVAPISLAPAMRWHTNTAHIDEGAAVCVT